MNVISACLSVVGVTIVEIVSTMARKKEERSHRTRKCFCCFLRLIGHNVCMIVYDNRRNKGSCFCQFFNYTDEYECEYNNNWMTSNERKMDDSVTSDG